MTSRSEAKPQELRQRGSDLPVLILTARDTLEDRITGLDSGADDYLLKPFELGELTARLRAIVRRRALNPALFALPLLGLLIWLGIGRGLRPMAHVAAEVEQRDPESLEPVSDENIPREILPLAFG